MGLDDLPVEILVQIATMNYGYCYREMLAIPLFARFALKNRKWLYTQMTKIGPSFIFKYRYFLFGELHREGGPAVEWVSGTKSWYQWGKRHRENGPAIEMFDGDKEWWLFGKEYKEKEWKEIVQSGKIEELRKLHHKY